MVFVWCVCTFHLPSQIFIENLQCEGLMFSSVLSPLSLQFLSFSLHPAFLPTRLQQIFCYKVSSLGNPLPAQEKALHYYKHLVFTARPLVRGFRRKKACIFFLIQLIHPKRGWRVWGIWINSIPQAPQGSVKMIASLILVHLYWISLLSVDDACHLFILILMKMCGADMVTSNAVDFPPSPLGHSMHPGSLGCVFQILQRPTA